MKNKKHCYTLVAQSLVNELSKDIRGENKDFLFGKIPSEAVMIGMIDGYKMLKNGLDVSPFKRASYIPSIGARFRVSKETKKITFSIRGKLFYSIKPTYEKQIKYLIDQICNPGVNDLESLKEFSKTIKNNPEKAEEKYRLVPCYEDFDLKDIGTLELDLDNIENSLKSINQKIQKWLDDKFDSVDGIAFSNKFPERHLEEFLDEDKFNSTVSANCQPFAVNWDIQVDGNLNEYEDYKEITIQLINETQNWEIPEYVQSAIFNGGLKIISQTGFKKIYIDSSKHYYADNPYLPAIGNNCCIVEVDSTTIETDNLPITVQNRLITVDKYNSYVEFTKLIEDPVSNLRFIAAQLNKKLNEYEDLYKIQENHKSRYYMEQFQKEITDFRCEIIRFENGISLIENKSDVREAFKYMNETFALNPYKGWRLFQIVFIVSEIADMIYCEYKDTPGFVCNDINNVDLIYFPTGGGKTETFLGCCIFSAFFDRIRGKENGITAIIKYPLRLLASQQLDRVLDLSIKANEIKHKNNISGEDFSVGFYTGSKNTPNQIKYDEKDAILATTQKDLNEKYRQIDICPKCGKPMNVYFDEKTWSLKHKCSECGFEPLIYIVDDEIYRFGSTFVVSTIDKMAIFGLQNDFKAFFGQSKTYCPKHGFFHGNRCPIRDCRETNYYVPNRKDPIPTLDIQDELHLVNESLGTFDAHYESAIYYYCDKLVPEQDRKKIKYIGATATISNFEQHIKNLYNKDSKMFPCSIKKENFYSKVDKDDICRIIIGAALNGASMINNIKRLVILMRQIVCNWGINSAEKLKELKKLGFDGDENDLKEILQYYLIQIVYTNSKNDTGNLKDALQNQGNNELAYRGLPTLNISEITANVEFKEIKDVIHQVDSATNKFKGPNMILATSSISHGVDESSFNQIYFYGMPNKTSEYIQAYSRVGRTYTGIVFDIFRLIRDRDRSFFKNFFNFHEYKEQLIDPVPINRYAKNAIYTTLPGIFSGIMLQHYTKTDRAIEITNLIRDGTITLDGLTKMIFDIYDCDNLESKIYQNIIEEEVKKMFLAFKNNVDASIETTKLLIKISSDKRGPMTNLRDVEVGYEVKKG